LRDRLLVNYSPLVKYVASRVGARMTEKSARYEDMLSWGVLGLLDAIETYEPDHPGTKAKFETYAISKIRWAILDQLRSQDQVPRRLRARAQEVEKAKTSLAQRLRRPATEEEIAAEAGMELAQYRSFLEHHSRTQLASLDAHGEGDEDPGREYGELTEIPSIVDPQSQANLEELRLQLVEAINKLEERERLVTSFYFYEGLTLKEIGKALELTEGRISQILKRALTKLREHLNGLLFDYGS
jgi:RNA polymerase sigma factor for flagellar operon FliA